MNKRAYAVLAVLGLVCMIPATSHAITAYSQNFEGLDRTDPAALSADGWVVYGNVFTALGVYQYGYGTFPAPNHSLAFCQVDSGQGGPDQGLQQLVVFSDYENADHAIGNLIESNVFHEQSIVLADVGTTWYFSFDAKIGNLEGATTAAAFIKTLNPSAGYTTTNLITADMTSIPDTWGFFHLAITIDAGLVGQLLQFGFTSTASNYEGSGVYYDNIVFSQESSGVPENPARALATMGQNYPNPFNPSTRIDFTLEQAGIIDLSVYDLAGRKVATVLQGNREAGAHHVNWSGKTDQGHDAAAGQYRFVLKTATGQLSRSMLLLK